MAPNTVGISNFVKPKKLRNHTFLFALVKELPDIFTIQVNCYKGLEHIVIGKYVVARPKEGESAVEEWPAEGQYGGMRGVLAYRKMMPKFWSVNRFKL